MKPLSFGGSLVLLSFWIAVASLFFGWVEVSFTSRSVSSGTIIAIEAAIVWVLWSYPLHIATSRKKMGNKAFIAIGTLAIALPVAIGYFIDQQKFVDVGPGVLVFFSAGVLLIVGLFVDQLQLMFGKSTLPILTEDIQNLRCGRCCWISKDDLNRHVRVHVLHAKGFAQFALEPRFILVENHGLHPWALGEAQVLLKHYEEQIRAIWRGRSQTAATVEEVVSEGALHRAGKTIGALFVGLYGRIKRS